MKIYWISFSYKGNNNGVCLIMADCQNGALDKVDNLGIRPNSDDVLVIELDELGEKDSHMEFNRLYNKSEMSSLGYKPLKVIR